MADAMAQYFWKGFSGVGDPWVNLDGRLNAPVGTPQYPHGLDRSSLTQSWVNSTGAAYVTRPPWRVCGVDYPVGIDRSIYPTDANLKDPAPGFVTGQPQGSTTGIAAALVAQGVSWDGSNQFQQGGGANNLTIDGWDFSLHNGITLGINGIGITVQNCKWVLGSNQTGTTNVGVGTGFGINGTSTFTCQKCVIIGSLTAGVAGVGSITFASAGTNTIEYCWLKDAWAENIVSGTDQASGFKTLVKYNIIENAGIGAGPSGGAVHGDWWQDNNSANSNVGVVDSQIIQFNLWLQTRNAGSGATQISTQGIPFPNQGQTKSENFDYNTIVYATQAGSGIGSLNFAKNTWTGYLSGTATCTNNWVDPSGWGAGNQNAWMTTANQDPGNPGPFNGNFVFANNTNMLDGTTLGHV